MDHRSRSQWHLLDGIEKEDQAYASKNTSEPKYGLVVSPEWHFTSFNGRGNHHQGYSGAKKGNLQRRNTRYEFNEDIHHGKGKPCQQHHFNSVTHEDSILV
jgi:hypothetical protein